jgi:hypothetical protein
MKRANESSSPANRLRTVPRPRGSMRRGLLVGALIVACRGDDDGPTQVEELVFAGEVEVLPGFSFDTGLQPPGSPVQAAFSVSAAGTVAVSAGAAPSGSSSEPTLSGLPERGTLEVEGGFALEGQLVIDVTGASYEGPIPGIEDLEIDVAAQTTFDPFALGEAVSVRAEIPPTRLPSIPLPGGIPGSLVLHVSEGSFLDVSLSGLGACVEGDEARYEVEIDRAGTLVISPSVEIEIPLLGTETFEIPELSVDLGLGSSELAMTAAIGTFGARPAQGDHVEGTCSGVGPGEPGTGGATSDGATTETPPTTGVSDDDTGDTIGEMPCVSDADCGEGLTCIDELCVPIDGICETDISYGDADLNACASAFCCEYVDVCTFDGTDMDGCKACLQDGGGPRCDGFFACMQEHCLDPAFPICDSGLASSDESLAACLSDECCAEFNACTMNGTDTEACMTCIYETGGQLCQPALECYGVCIASCDHDECTEGSPLQASCSVCTQAICDADPYCCTTAWDQVCVNAVASTPVCIDAGITC